MSEYFTTDELAEFLRIKPRKVYDLVSTDKVPYSRVMGKLLFSKSEISNWISGGQNNISNQKNPPNILLGSHDPLLELAVKQSKSGIAMSFDGSTEGLERFKLNQGIASGLHIYDSDLESWNVPIVKKCLEKQDFVLMEWAKRDRGLIYKPKEKSDEVDLEDYVSRPEKVSAAEISAICAEAGLQAVRKNRYVILPKDFENGYTKHVKTQDTEYNFYK